MSNLRNFLKGEITKLIQDVKTDAIFINNTFPSFYLGTVPKRYKKAGLKSAKFTKITNDKVFQKNCG